VDRFHVCQKLLAVGVGEEDGEGGGGEGGGGGDRISWMERQPVVLVRRESRDRVDPMDGADGARKERGAKRNRAVAGKGDGLRDVGSPVGVDVDGGLERVKVAVGADHEGDAGSREAGADLDEGRSPDGVVFDLDMRGAVVDFKSVGDLERVIGDRGDRGIIQRNCDGVIVEVGSERGVDLVVGPHVGDVDLGAVCEKIDDVFLTSHILFDDDSFGPGFIEARTGEEVVETGEELVDRMADEDAARGSPFRLFDHEREEVVVGKALELLWGCAKGKIGMVEGGVPEPLPHFAFISAGSCVADRIGAEAEGVGEPFSPFDAPFSGADHGAQPLLLPEILEGLVKIAGEEKGVAPFDERFPLFVVDVGVKVGSL
jgi:hypothetical protein